VLRYQQSGYNPTSADLISSLRALNKYSKSVVFFELIPKPALAQAERVFYWPECG